MKEDAERGGDHDEDDNPIEEEAEDNEPEDDGSLRMKM